MIGLEQPYTQIYDSERVTICLGALEPYDFDGLLEFLPCERYQSQNQ